MVLTSSCGVHVWLQEEHTLCSLSGGAVTPESQLDESTSPADTTEDDLLPLKPWGRSQSLPAYADLIMVGSGIQIRSIIQWCEQKRGAPGHQGAPN